MLLPISIAALPCVGSLAATAKGTMPLSKMFYQMRIRINESLPSTSGQCPTTEVLDPLLAERETTIFTDLIESESNRTRDISIHVFNSASVITGRSAGTTSGGNVVNITEYCGVDISEYASTELVTQTPEPIQAALASLYLLGELGVPHQYIAPMTIYPHPSIPEWWMYSNPTPNAHPIHVHEGGFSLQNRTFNLPNDPNITVLPPRGWENGPKDTIMVYQYSNAATKNVFFNPGIFVYHCHILTHGKWLFVMLLLNFL